MKTISEKTIQELHEAKILAIKAEIDMAKKQAVGFSVLIISVLATISFLLYWNPAVL